MFWSCIFQQNHQLRCPIAVPRVLVPVQNGKPPRYRWPVGKNDERTAIKKEKKKCDSQNEETLLLWKNRGIVMESSCDFILKAKNLGRYRWTDWRWIIHGSFMKNNHPFRNFVLDMEVFQTYFPDSPFSKPSLSLPSFKRKIFGDLNFSFFWGGLYYTDPYCILWKNKAVFFFRGSSCNLMMPRDTRALY